MRKYETLLIARPDMEDEQLKKLLDDVSGIIAREGGSVTGVDVWGLRRLEYPIKHEESGHYAVVNFESGPGAVKELERVMGIRDEVLRTKTLVKEKR
ncbi:MAG: 30S ribosomal protein S6 [Actinomycetota bacterium]